MQQIPVLSYSEQKSILNIFGTNALIINENWIIEMVSSGIIQLLQKSEENIIGQKCFNILKYQQPDSDKCEICKKIDFDNINYENYTYLNDKKYKIRCLRLEAENNKRLILLEEEFSEFFDLFKKGTPEPGIQPAQKRIKQHVFLNEYGVFLKIFKEAPVGLAVLKMVKDNGYVITTNNDRFKKDFNQDKTSLFNELFLDIPKSWINKNLMKYSCNDIKEYKGFFNKTNKKYYDLYFVFLSSNLLLLTTIDDTENISYKRSMVNSMFDSIENERARISRDLHDSIGALLSSISMRMNVIKSGKLSHDKVKNVINNTCDLLGMAIKETKEIAHNIKPYELVESSFQIAISSYIDKVKKASDIDIYYNYKKFDTYLDEGKEIHIFRIICELINNTIKHADANVIKIKLYNIDKKICLEYKDDGQGFEIEKVNLKKGDNMGIKNIYHRINDMNGACRFDSVPGYGMKFKMII